MRVSILEATKLTGKSDKTLYRHISQGKISCHVDEKGVKTLDTIDLIATYGELRNPESEKTLPVSAQESDDFLDLRVENASLKAENQGLKTLVIEKDKRLELLEFRKSETQKNTYNVRTIMSGALIGAALLLGLLVLKFFFNG